jgi:hypothetical protein
LFRIREPEGSRDLHQLSRTASFTTAAPPISPLMLSDHLLHLAEEADSAGFHGTAEYLLGLASDVLDEPAAVRLCTA